MSVEVRDATFQKDVIASREPVVVEFWAMWCGNCRRIASAVAALGEEFDGVVRLASVDADENPELVARFGVTSTPTFVVVDRGQVVTTMVGAQPAPLLRGLFETARDAGTNQASPGWVPAAACTLPTADRPKRLREFDGLFRSVREIERAAPTRLRLVLGDTAGVAEQARVLAARETECCSFFDFSVTAEDGGVVVDVQVPEERAGVLDGIAEQAEAARAGAPLAAGT